MNIRKELRGKLPHGYRKKIALKFKVSVKLVDGVLGGDATDYHGIIDFAIKLAEQNVRQRKISNNKIQNRIRELKTT